jgi:hypothetical protein
MPAGKKPATKRVTRDLQTARGRHRRRKALYGGKRPHRHQKSVNATSVAPFVSHITSRLTSFQVSAGSVYDWRARQQTLPVDFSTTQVLKIGAQNVSFGVGGRYYVEKAAGGPD